MRIFVCVKQVPDTSGRVAVKKDGTLNRASMEIITNPDDLHAMEAALQRKDETGCRVIALTMGPPQAEQMLRELLAMGADEAVLVSDRAFGGSDTYGTSEILAAAIRHMGFGPEDLILCGTQAIDGDTAQVGPQLAEKLGIPQAAAVRSLCWGDDGHVTAESAWDGGSRTVEMEMPCLITCTKELNRPRYMTIPGIFASGEKPLCVLDAQMLKAELGEARMIGLEGSPTKILTSFTQPRKGVGRMLEGGEDACRELVEQLKEKHLI